MNFGIPPLPPIQEIPPTNSDLSFFSANHAELLSFLKMMRTDYDRQKETQLNFKQKLFTLLKDPDVKDLQIKKIFTDFIRYIFYKRNPESFFHHEAIHRLCIETARAQPKELFQEINMLIHGTIFQIIIEEIHFFETLQPKNFESLQIRTRFASFFFKNLLYKPHFLLSSALCIFPESNSFFVQEKANIIYSLVLQLLNANQAKIISDTFEYHYQNNLKNCFIQKDLMLKNAAIHFFKEQKFYQADQAIANIDSAEIREDIFIIFLDISSKSIHG